MFRNRLLKLFLCLVSYFYRRRRRGSHSWSACVSLVIVAIPAGGCDARPEPSWRACRVGKCSSAHALWKSPWLSRRARLLAAAAYSCDMTRSSRLGCCGDGVCAAGESEITCMADCPGVTTDDTCGEEPHSDRGGRGPGRFIRAVDGHRADDRDPQRAGAITHLLAELCQVANGSALPPPEMDARCLLLPR